MIQIHGIDMDSVLDMYDDDMDIFVPILRSFIPNALNVMDQLRQHGAAGASSLADYATAVHGLKSISANVCAEKLRRIAADLEAKAKAGDFAAVQSGNEALLHEAQLVADSAQAWLSEQDLQTEPERSESDKTALNAETQRIVFAVDDNEANLTACEQMLKSDYTVYPIPSAARMFDILQHVRPDVILLDVEMPEMNGYEAIKKLKEHDDYKNIPVLFLSARDDAVSEQEGLDLGAADFIHKPFSSAQLLKLISANIPQV